MTRNDMLKGRLSILDIVSIPAKSTPEPNVNENNPLLDLIFAPDERGCLNGDLSQFLSDKTNPQVKEFIQSQLMVQNPDDKGLSLNQDLINKMNGVINDDDIARFSRNHGESPEQYAMRIVSFFYEEKAKNVAKAKFNREKASLEKLGFNFDN